MKAASAQLTLERGAENIFPVLLPPIFVMKNTDQLSIVKNWGA